MTVDRWTEHETIAQYHLLRAEEAVNDPAASPVRANTEALIALTHMQLAANYLAKDARPA